MPEPTSVQRRTTRLMSVVMIMLGVAIIARTVAGGGGPIAVGLLLGVLFVAAGAGRIYVTRKQA